MAYFYHGVMVMAYLFIHAFVVLRLSTLLDKDLLDRDTVYSEDYSAKQ